ncbi:glycosyltransferase [Arthrobacter sp. zg-Y1143]|nr:glycosyltransferase [Arthrobacter sp. zg-Y1143]MDK1329069.1 glycosyltransferase [Arthrobacter sp. zg-Y1143]
MVIPVYMGATWLETCLNSLNKQTLDHARFEAILIFNGPDDGSAALAEAFGQRHPSLNIQQLMSSTASASHARNLGTGAAAGKYLTWLDCDDWISAEYLELMLLSSRRGIVPLAQIVNVSEDGSHDELSLINRSILGHDGHLISPADFHRGLSFMTCKLIPTWMARKVPFNESLRSGEDVALYGEMFARYSFQFSLLPALAGAKYFRLMRDSSVSRQEPSFDFLVTQRVDVISSLNQTLNECRAEALPLVKGFINSQASFIKRYYHAHPEDQSVIADILAQAGFRYFPWTNWFDVVSRLVIAYNFVPYSDTGAMVMAKRIREEGQAVDVITHNMDNVRSKDATHNAIARPYVQYVGSVPGPANFAHSGSIADFCKRGSHIVESWTRSKNRHYTEVYSRAMWPASHFLAALYKARHPHVRWVAEFSDPVQLNTDGEFRSSPITMDTVFEEILQAVPDEQRAVLLDNMNVFFWTEHIAYLLADEVVFTNTNQRDVMLAYADVRALDKLGQESAVALAGQPTLAPSFYRIKDVELALSPAYVNIGYFGEFYATRGLDEVVAALSGLPAADRERVRLHVFTSNADAAQSRLLAEESELARNVAFRAALPYFEFLNALRKFDCLLVNDAVTGATHSVNPYLPSKLSDYRGSGTRIWALVEGGSVLSQLEHDYVSSVGDAEGAAAILLRLVQGLE